MKVPYVNFEIFGGTELVKRSSSSMQDVPSPPVAKYRAPWEENAMLFTHDECAASFLGKLDRWIVWLWTILSYRENGKPFLNMESRVCLRFAPDTEGAATAPSLRREFWLRCVVRTSS